MKAYMIMRKKDKKYAYDFSFGSKSNFLFVNAGDTYRVPKLFSEHDINSLLRQCYIPKGCRIVEVDVREVRNERLQNKNIQ